MSPGHVLTICWPAAHYRLRSDGEFVATQQISMVSRLGFLTAPMSLNRGQPNFARCLAVSWARTLYIHFWVSCPLTEIGQVENSLCVEVLCSPILAALLYSTRAVGVSKTLWLGIFTRQGNHPVRQWVIELSSLYLKKHAFTPCFCSFHLQTDVNAFFSYCCVY